MFTVYKTTNIINGHFYIWVHKTDFPNDDYLGSGYILRKAIQKYGRSSFYKEILCIFDTESEAYGFEAMVVDTRLVARSDCYNAKVGGLGGWSSCHNHPLATEFRRKGGLCVGWTQN